ncbi:hypothetical protein [uncultured Thermomonospora sp.]|uniref:hypothetical protein n=1 Tax=uncultured Thermomonospora sp. TaxID=671175 RepID=UPI00259B6F08|nr:hypothetical protein [uncultured Thermomonospora sp.]
MTETGTSNDRTASLLSKIAKAWPPRIVTELREERRKLHEERVRLMDDLRSAIDDVTRATTKLRAAADDAVQRIEQAIARLEVMKEFRPSEGERLCIELLHYWKIENNWNKNALRSLEALAKDGKGSLAQWGAKELLSGGTIKVGKKTYPRLKQLAEDESASEQRNGRPSPPETGVIPE